MVVKSFLIKKLQKFLNIFHHRYQHFFMAFFRVINIGCEGCWLWIQDLSELYFIIVWKYSHSEGATRLRQSCHNNTLLCVSPNFEFLILNFKLLWLPLWRNWCVVYHVKILIVNMFNAPRAWKFLIDENKNRIIYLFCICPVGYAVVPGTCRHKQCKYQSERE